MAKGIQPYIKRNGTLLKIQRFPLLSKFVFNELTAPDYQRRANKITYVDKESWNTLTQEIGYINGEQVIEVIECDNSYYPYVRIQQEVVITKEVEKETLEMISKLKNKAKDNLNK